MVFFTSDTHFSHNKPFIYEPRGFSSAEEMNEKIIENWNSVVKQEDEVYLLGDVVLSNMEAGIAALKRLNGKIHIICGNHDTTTKIKAYAQCPNVVEICDGKFLKLGKQNFYLSHYPCVTANHDDAAPLNRKIISLCGHIHSKDKWCDFDKGLVYHVELDAHNCFPISIDAIMADIQQKLEEDKIMNHMVPLNF